jgi:HEAT repeat protein
MYLGQLGDTALPELVEALPELVEAMPKLVEALASPNLRVRTQAAWVLGKLAKQADDHGLEELRDALRAAVPTLKQLRDAGGGEAAEATSALVAMDPFCREEAAGGRTGSPEQELLQERIQSLIQQLSRSDGPEAIMHALVQIGRPAVPALIEALADREPFVRLAAIQILGKIEDAAVPVSREIVPALIGALADPDSFVRLAAVRTLVKIGDAALPALLEALGAPTPRVRDKAAFAVGEIVRLAVEQGPEEHREALRAAVPPLERLSGDPLTSLTATRALKELARFDPKAAAALTLAASAEVGDTQATVELEPPGPERGPVTPKEEEPDETEQSGVVEREQQRPPAEQLQAELVSRLKELIPTLPDDPKEKAQLVVTLNQVWNQTFWEELRPELRPVIKDLLRDIPADYAGKQARCSLINKLLNVLRLSIAIRDEDGNLHECTVHPSRARESDAGRLHLRERKVIRGVRGSYRVPAPDEIEIIDATQLTPQEEQAPAPDLPAPAAGR